RACPPHCGRRVPARRGKPVRTLLAVVAAALLVPAPSAVLIPYDDAKPILEANGRTLSAAEWRAWAATRNAEIRARLAQGDEDSIVNLWLYGTSFTNQPRATAEHLARLPRREIETLIVARLDDLVTGMAAPGASERLRFARQVVER